MYPEILYLTLVVVPRTCILASPQSQSQSPVPVSLSSPRREYTDTEEWGVTGWHQASCNLGTKLTTLALTFNHSAWTAYVTKLKGIPNNIMVLVSWWIYVFNRRKLKLLTALFDWSDFFCHITNITLCSRHFIISACKIVNYGIIWKLLQKCDLLYKNSL